MDAVASQILEDAQDVFALVKITVDTKKTVAPITQAVGGAAGLGSQSKNELLKFRTITKYSYFESGDKWIKVLLPDLANLGDHPKDKVTITFPTQRSFEVKVEDFKGSNWKFAVPKTQCRILPQACTHTFKSSGLQINLRKKETSDNWYSLFKTKAIGEKESDDEV